MTHGTALRASQWLSRKEPTCNAGDVGLIARLGRPPREETSNPFQYSCLGNPMDRGAWQSVAHGVARVGHDRLNNCCFQNSLNYFLPQLPNLPFEPDLLCLSTFPSGICCCLVAKSCPTLRDPMDCSPPGSSVHGISQARILEWVAIPFSRGSPRPRD